MRESFKKVVRRNPFFSSMAKKDVVDDVLNSEAFLNKKVGMLKKQIAITEADIERVEAEGQKNWEEWGPQVSERREVVYVCVCDVTVLCCALAPRDRVTLAAHDD